MIFSFISLCISFYNLPNIPVFGDAELIIGLVEEDGQGKINGQAIGSIDNKQVMNQVVNILEGGETAFKIRKEKYQF